jgi:hypothetical protein
LFMFVHCKKFFSISIIVILDGLLFFCLLLLNLNVLNILVRNGLASDLSTLDRSLNTLGYDFNCTFETELLDVVIH